ncbi:DEAD/DEAH box helicase family protein [Lachnospiraceae bacterium 46-15]
MKRELYQWQEECLERWFSNKGRGMVQAVTGAGKTFLALMAAARLEKQQNRSLRVKIVVPTAALMRQWNRALREFLEDSGRDSEEWGEIGLRGVCVADCG